jgi:hypothetical protein
MAKDTRPIEVRIAEMEKARVQVERTIAEHFATADVQFMRQQEEVLAKLDDGIAYLRRRQHA